MIKKNIVIAICLLITASAFAQDSTKVFVIQKINPDLIFDAFGHHFSKQIVFQSIEIEVYKVHNGKKIDSINKQAAQILTRNDTITYSLYVPNIFLSDGDISLRPVYQTYIKQSRSLRLTTTKDSVKKISQVNLKIKSDPSGATVYLVPKIYWELNPNLRKFNLNALQSYQVSQGPTTVNTFVQDYVYEVVFHLRNSFSKVECAPNHLHLVDSVFSKISVNGN